MYGQQIVVTVDQSTVMIEARGPKGGNTRSGFVILSYDEWQSVKEIADSQVGTWRQIEAGKEANNLPPCPYSVMNHGVRMPCIGPDGHTEPHMTR